MKKTWIPILLEAPFSQIQKKQQITTSAINV